MSMPPNFKITIPCSIKLPPNVSSLEIEKIVDMRFQNLEREFQVKWRNSFQLTWESERRVSQHPAFDEFMQMQRHKVERYIQQKIQAASRSTDQSISTDLFAIAQNPKEFEKHMRIALHLISQQKSTHQGYEKLIKKCQKLKDENTELRLTLANSQHAQEKILKQYKAQVKKKLVAAIDLALE